MSLTDLIPKPGHALENLSKVIGNLSASLALPIKETRDLSGIIRDFELTYELTWKTLRNLLQIKGHTSNGARDAFKKCYPLHILDDEKVWLDMIEDRNATVHTHKKLAREMVERIRANYKTAFERVLKTCQNEDV